MMYLRSLVLAEFRNFHRQKLQLRERLNFFVGANGQGKTNLLEAVYLLSRGESFRPAENSSFVRKSVDSAKVTAEFMRCDLDNRVDLLISEKSRKFFVNGKAVNSYTLQRSFPTVLFSPESLAVVKEGPVQRRLLADEIVLSHDPKKLTLLRDFDRALRSRNRLLKELAELLSGSGISPARSLQLESLNKIYLLLATHLTFARILALRSILADFNESMRLISGQLPGEMSVDYIISDESALNWDEAQIFDAIRKRHLELSGAELRTGRSLVGPHKHDIKFLFAGNDSRFYCSQGQQRALILALKIAQIMYHFRVHQTYPILLLDDVLSELDEVKRVNLMKYLESISAQILITSTDLTWSEQFAFERNSVFSVHQGEVREITSFAKTGDLIQAHE